MYWRAYLGGAGLAPIFIWQVLSRQVSVPMNPFKVYKSASVSHMLHCACYVVWASTLNAPQTLFWARRLPAYYVSLAHLKRLTPSQRSNGTGPLRIARRSGQSVTYAHPCLRIQDSMHAAL